MEVVDLYRSDTALNAYRLASEVLNYRGIVNGSWGK